MFVDARRIPDGSTVETEICIVGAGVAGITLAREFRARSFRVCLLEGGGLEFNDATQALYGGELAGQPYMPLTAARVRFFGGASNHWAGWCQPLDEIDFEEREWIPHSGWPFSRTELVPFYRRAQEVLEIGPFAYDAAGWETGAARPLRFEAGRVTTQMAQFSPTRFGTAYRREIAGAENVSTYLNANAVELETDSGGRTVRRLQVACLEGNRFSVSARLFVLAAGGIENARLLLLSNRTQRNGLGNEHDLVGRYFMDHTGLVGGTILLADPDFAPALYLNRVSALPTTVLPPVARREQRVMGQLMLTPEVMRAERLANFTAVLQSPSRVESARGEGLLRPLFNLVKNVNRRVFTPPLVLRNIVEPIPDPDSRVTLIGERDSLGLNRVRLDWRMSPGDERTIRRSQEIIGAELGRAGLGRLMMAAEGSWPASLELGLGHHMGTTRMHHDPARGVVDANCRVHGMANLFIAGSSVFPTFGYAPPTLTIVALALRLADHMRASGIVGT